MFGFRDCKSSSRRFIDYLRSKYRGLFGKDKGCDLDVYAPVEIDESSDLDALDLSITLYFLQQENEKILQSARTMEMLILRLKHKMSVIDE